MSDIAIRIDGLGKRYRLGAGAGGGLYTYRALRDVLADALVAPVRGLRRLSGRNAAPRERRDDNILWALKDISLDIKQGEVVGIIGPNGAGKTTLLKVLSRITEPTEGRVELHGRVGSLLEVGTGFHPELTGRENIYLNGAILGMTRREIAAKFDEIVAFAETEKFLETPVKRYSSGMYVRLAFAVAAHLEPEILLVDEVLAVGDAQFQKKCLGKMGDVARGGRTVLFVSHNMGAITSLTHRALCIDGGQLASDGPSTDVIAAYLRTAFPEQANWMAAERKEIPVQFLSVRASDGRPDTRSAEFNVDNDLTIEIRYEVRRPLQGCILAVNVNASDGAHVLCMEDVDRKPELLGLRLPGTYRATVVIPGTWLACGAYFLRVGSAVPGREEYENMQVISFTFIESGLLPGRSRTGRRGYLRPMLPWVVEPAPECAR